MFGSSVSFLCYGFAMLQAPCFECLTFDPFSFQQDDFITPEVDVGRRHVVKALMISLVIVVGHERFDTCLEIARQEVVLQKHAVFQGLMPPLDFALGLRVIRRASDMIHRLIFEPFCQIARDVG